MINIRFPLIVLVSSFWICCQPKCHDSGLIKMTFTIADGKVGHVTVGDDINKTLETLGSFSVNKIDNDCEECTSSGVTYVVLDCNQLEMFTIDPGIDQDSKKISRIRTSDPRFKTEKGLGVGMTYGMIKREYKIIGVDASEGILHVVVEGFAGSFVLETPQDENIWDLTKDTVPDFLKITEILII